ncbi:MAG: hypothetical protein WC356_06505 [Candidatus Micrarchaeia archaeon]|jgi:hypothetical protein
MAYQVTMTGTTANAVQKEIYQADGTRFLIAASASYRIRGMAIAQNTSTIATHEWEFDLLIKNVAGVTSWVGYPVSSDLSMDTGTEAWLLTFSADDTNDALGVKVTGAAGTTINWSVGFDYVSLGYTPTVSAASSSLNVPQLVELVKLHHPKIPDTMIVKKMSNAQKRFVRETKLNTESSTILLTSQSVTGYTLASPLTLTDTASDYTWSFYKDGTTSTLTLKPNTNVVFYTNIGCVDSAGETVGCYAVSFNDDGSIYFYDEYGTALTDFDDDGTYMTFDFVKVPDALTNASSSTPEIQSEFHEALSNLIISDLYTTRGDLQVTDRLMLAKHHKNLYEEYKTLAKRAYYMQNNTFPISSFASVDFEED